LHGSRNFKRAGGEFSPQQGRHRTFPSTRRTHAVWHLVDALKEKTMPHGMSRRHLIVKILLTGALLPALDLARGSQTAALTPLDSKDSAASALGFVSDAATAGSNPMYKKGQRCASCVHYLGQPTDATAGCNIYSGRSVPANGWCAGWSQRPG
jgi:High potential iron-sulfur protein